MLTYHIIVTLLPQVESCHLVHLILLHITPHIIIMSHIRAITPISPNQTLPPLDSGLSTVMSGSTHQTLPLSINNAAFFLSVLKFEKLNDSNWLVWKTWMCAVFNEKDTLDIIMGKMPKPSNPIAVADWIIKNCKSVTLITSSMKDNQMDHIMGLETATLMWDALCAIHEPGSQQSILSTKWSVYLTYAKEGENIAMHFTMMKACHD